MALGAVRFERRAAAGALRAARVERSKRVVRTADQSGGVAAGASRQSLRGLARRSLPARSNNVSTHGTSHCWRHVAHALTSCGTAAGAVRRDLPAACGGGERSEWRDGENLDRARINPRESPRNDAHAVVDDCRKARAPGRPAVSLGPTRSREGRRRERSACNLGRTEREDLRIEGTHVPARAREGLDSRRHDRHWLLH